MRRCVSRRCWAGVVVTAAALLGCGPAVAAVRVGTVVRLPAGTQPVASVAADRALTLTLALRPRDPAGLAAYVAAVATPGSPGYRRYLTPRGFARRFGAAPAAIAAVERSLRAHGLEPRSVNANGLSISVTADAGTVERAFSTELARVRLPSGAEATVNTVAPALDPGVAHLIQAVIGLSGLDHPRPRLTRRAGPAAGPATGAIGARAISPRRAGHVVTGGPQPCAAAAAAAGPQQAYTADQIASAYEFPGLYRRGDEGQGVTVALYELESDDPADIAAYQSCYGTHASVSYVPVDGGAGSGPGSGEAAFDIEQVIGLAPRANLLVYQAPNSNGGGPGAGPYDLFSTIVSQDRAQVVTTSWGQCEPLEGSHDAEAEAILFEEAAAQGQTILSAAGDEGSEDCNAPPPSLPDARLEVDDPASQPFVTGVGGTSLTSLGPPPSETAWNNGGNLAGLVGIVPGAGGGGISDLWPMPLYQSRSAVGLHVAQALSSGAPCHVTGRLCREVPDVSADGDPRTGYLIYYNGSGREAGSPSGWQGTGGTSGASPLWAALTSLADADPGCHSAPVGFLNPTLYRLAGAGPGTYLNDVVSGNNDFTGTAGGRYPAAGGYDMATGLGSPRATALADALCAEALRLSAPPVAYTFRGARPTVSVHVSDGPGAVPAVGAKGLPAGLRIARATGAVSGRPRRLGISHVQIAAVDRFGAWRLVRLTWTIDTPPSVGSAQLSGPASASPGLSVAVRSGRFEPRLERVGLSLPAGLSLRGRGGRGTRVRVIGTHGRPLGFSLSGSGARLTVSLARPSSQVRLVLARGALRANGVARLAAAGRLRLRVATRDAARQFAARTVALRG